MVTWLASRAATKLGYTPEMFAAIGGRWLALSASGKNVTFETAQKVSSYKRGVQLISDYLAKTPFHVKAGQAKDKAHPAWTLVRHWAIWHQVSAFQFRRSLTVCALMRGNGYGLIERDRNATPIRLHVLDPSKVEPMIRGGQLVYRNRLNDQYWEASDIIHIRGFGTDGYVGLDPLTGYAKDVLGLAIAQQDYAAGYYASGGTPSVYAYSENVLDEEHYNRLVSETGPLRRAVDDPHRIPVLDAVELRSLGLTAEQTQLVESREFSLKDIANALGMSVHKLNGDGKSSYKSLEEENRAFRDDTLDPFLCQFEIEYRKLLTEEQQQAESHDVEAVRESLTRTNMLDRAKYLQVAIGGPWMTQAEGREVDSLPTIEGADELLKPLNMTPPLIDEKDPPDDEDEGEDSRAHRTAAELAVFGDVFARMTRRLSVAAAAAAKRADGMTAFLETLGDKHRDVIAEALSPAVRLVRAEDISETLADELIASVRDELTAAASRSDVAAAVATVGQELESRAGALALASWERCCAG